MFTTRIVAGVAVVCLSSGFALGQSASAKKADSKKAEAAAKADATAKADAAKTEKAAASKKAFEDEIADIRNGLNDAKQNLTKQQQHLNVVRETPIGLPSGHAKLAIVYRNDMTSLFQPVKYEVTVDGFSIYSRTDPLTFGPNQKEVELYRGTLSEGEHQVIVSITMRGNGYGAFSYLKDYKFVGHAGHAFNVKDDKVTQVKIISAEKAGVDPKDRPTIEFQDSLFNVSLPTTGGETQ